MSGRKGMKHYSESIKKQIRQEHETGSSLSELSKKYGVSIYSVESWCGLRPEVNRRQMFPQKKGRPSSKPEDKDARIRRLEMENELLRNFLQELERK